MPRTTNRRLDRQSKAGYDKGRSIWWQVAWVAVSHLIFQAWWLPISLRPHILRAFGAYVGRGVYIRDGVRIHWPWKLGIGDYCQIGDHAWIINLEQVTLGNNVAVSQQAILCAGSHDPKSETFKYDNGPITVGDGAWVTLRAIVLRGVDVPPGVTIPAGTVVRRSEDCRVPSARRASGQEAETKTHVRAGGTSS